VAEMSARFWAELVSDWEIDILKVPIYSPLACPWDINICPRADLEMSLG
jgi:hypothetical protein